MTITPAVATTTTYTYVDYNDRLRNRLNVWLAEIDATPTPPRIPNNPRIHLGLILETIGHNDDATISRVFDTLRAFAGHMANNCYTANANKLGQQWNIVADVLQSIQYEVDTMENYSSAVQDDQNHNCSLLITQILAWS